jgi:gamma-glutamylcyclotransferase (GGCT)/AIG2-like uncharacterized protein YtfP
MERAGNSADSDALVFVYGSLKRHMANHRELQGAAWLCEARIEGLTLHDLGPFPMAIRSSEAGCTITGEVYRVGPKLLANLDRFEGVPRLYERQLHHLTDGIEVWVYVGHARQVRHSRRIASGVWNGPGNRFKRTTTQSVKSSEDD